MLGATAEAVEASATTATTMAKRRAAGVFMIAMCLLVEWLSAATVETWGCFRRRLSNAGRADKNCEPMTKGAAAESMG